MAATDPPSPGPDRRGLPPEAYEPVPGERYRPYVAPETSLPELTVRAVAIGLVLAVVFGAANAYLGLKVGLTVSASIPAAVMAVAIFRAVRRGSILETNMVQTIGSAGESVAAGVIFTLPALYIWQRTDPSIVVDLVEVSVIAAFGAAGVGGRGAGLRRAVLAAVAGRRSRDGRRRGVSAGWPLRWARALGPRALGLSLGAACLWLGAVACSSGADPAPVPETVMSREAFVDVYVALRRGGLQSAQGVVSASERERILTEHGATEEALLGFAEAHGGDAAFMKEVWDEVEQRLDEEESGTG